MKRRKAFKSGKLVSLRQAQSVLRRKIRESGLSQVAYAEKIGERYATLNAVVNGHRGLSRGMAQHLGIERVIAYSAK